MKAVAAPLLATPAELTHRWAVWGAVQAANGWQSHCNADGDRWHYDDGGGNWADLLFTGGDNLLLVGHDHEYSETWYGTGDKQSGNLLPGLPTWCQVVVDGYLSDHADGIGFVYLFTSGQWIRSEYDIADGFAALDPPMSSDSALLRALTDHFDGLAFGTGCESVFDPASVNAAVDAGPLISETLLDGLLGGMGRDIGAGVRAARSFMRR